ncbi:glycosyltransferase [Geobacter argillaceus]|uniref:GT2 family glycosyltransferase n=1 Tax=Geobacter argillaceus TaxID=345631 RepID=A0A562WU47_9BACT|nr:glycosyltransferase [Geobacter argillaceus]TWJ33023.1 GT2 family glycosyltransferase [Geobacter argillaceus]
MKSFPVCTIGIVNYNGKKYLDKLFKSLGNINYPSERLELILVDNGSTDGTVEFMASNYNNVKIINCDNNFARALNLVIESASGDYVGFLNNDMEVDKNWLMEMVLVFYRFDNVAAVGSKIMFEDRKTINSVGHKALGDYYYMDLGINEIDKGQYDKICVSDGICGGSILWNKKCLELLGLYDEDYIMYYEDVEIAQRCMASGFKLMYSYKSVVYHKFHGSGNNYLAYLLSNRNRLLYVARYHSDQLGESLLNSQLHLNGEMEIIKDIMPLIIVKLFAVDDVDRLRTGLLQINKYLQQFINPQDIQQIIARVEIHHFNRPIKVAIYDHVMHVIGGGQRYAATIAEELNKENYNVTYIGNREIALHDLERWYGLSLEGVKLKIIHLPYYDNLGDEIIDPNLATQAPQNPLEPISEVSAGYDIFVNANMAVQVNPLSPVSILICHFPDAERSRYFYADNYDYVINNSKYGSEWTLKRWDIEAYNFLYPSVDMQNDMIPDIKENIILSVARFEPGGSKKQLEMINAFIQLCALDINVKEKWTLCLAGGTISENPYLEKLKKIVSENADLKINIMTNLGLIELKQLYAKSKIFWHACGLSEDNPHLREHFGMTTVEAMQNYCVPVVFNGGGQKEIVEHGVSGYLFNDIYDLISNTVIIVNDSVKLKKVSEGSALKAMQFSRSSFNTKVKDLFKSICYEKFFDHATDINYFLRKSNLLG